MDGDRRPLGDAQAVLLVCSRCNRTGAQAERDGERAGGVLLRSLRAACIPPAIRIQSVACMSGCKRACVVGLMAAGKVGYLFGDLQPDAEAAEAIGTLAAVYAAAPDGVVARQARPPLLQAGILARLPPLAWVSDFEITWPTPSTAST